MENFFSKIKENEIINKASKTFILKIFGSLFGYIFLLVVTRNFGAESWGVFVLCLAILNITSMLSRCGIDMASLKYVSQYNDNLSKVKGIYTIAISFIFIFSLLMSIILFLNSQLLASYLFDKPHLADIFKTISFILIPFSILSLNSQTLRGLKKIKVFAFLHYTARFMFALIIFFISYYFIKIDNFNLPIYTFIISILICMIISSYYILPILKSKKINRLITIKQFFNTSYPMMLSSSILLLMAWVDTLILGVYTSETDVGVFNVALKLALVTSIVIESVNSIVAPKISETYNNNLFKKFNVIVKQSTRIIFFTSLPIFILLLIFPEFLLSFFGSDFLSAKNTLMILLVGQIFNSSCGSVGLILQMTGKQKIVQNVLFFSLILNIVLNFILIPKFGYKGAAIASSSSIIFWNLILVFYVKKYYKINSFII